MRSLVTTCFLLLALASSAATIRGRVVGGKTNGALIGASKYAWFNQTAIQQQSLNEKAGHIVIVIVIVIVEAQPGNFSRSNLSVSPKQAPALPTAGLTYGRRFLDRRLGFIAAASWQDQYFGTSGTFTDVRAELNETRQSINVSSAPRLMSSHQRNVGLVMHVDFILNACNRLGWHNLLLLSDSSQARTSSDTTLTDQHTTAGTGTTPDHVRTLTQRQLVENARLEGLHELRSNLLLDWAAVVTEGRERAPDWATINLVYLLRVDPSDPTGQRIQRTQSFLEPVERHPAPGPAGGRRPFTAINDAPWTVYNVLGNTGVDASDYDATEDIVAGYGQAKAEFGALQVLGGGRVEPTSQAVSTTATPLLPYQDMLPSRHSRYALTPSQNLRLSYYAGISRPSLAEKIGYVVRFKCNIQE